MSDFENIDIDAKPTGNGKQKVFKKKENQNCFWFGLILLHCTTMTTLFSACLDSH